MNIVTRDQKKLEELNKQKPAKDSSKIKECLEKEKSKKETFKDKSETKRKLRNTTTVNEPNYVESEFSESINAKAKTKMPPDKDLSEIPQLSTYSGNEDTVVMDRSNSECEENKKEESISTTESTSNSNSDSSYQETRRFNSNLPCQGTLEFVPEEKRKEIFEELHCSPIGGHQGVSKTHNRIKRNFYWENLKEDIQRRIQQCINCQ